MGLSKYNNNNSMLIARGKEGLWHVGEVKECGMEMERNLALGKGYTMQCVDVLLS